jgi:hypothetical protein
MTHPYTGPTGFTLRDGVMHIEGYPDAEVVSKLSTKIGKRIADLRLHQSDLRFCERILQIYGNMILVGSPSDVAHALWIAILVKFYSCFGASEARMSLNAKKVYAGRDDAMVVFHFYKNIRNKHIVHDENNHSYPLTGVVFGKNFEDVQDILSLTHHFLHEGKEELQNIYNLVDHAYKYVCKEVNVALAAAFEEVNAMTLEARRKMPQLQITVPVIGDEGSTRKY